MDCAGDIFYYTATADAGMDRTVKFTDLKTGKGGFVRSDKGTWNGFLDPAGKYMVCTFTDLNTPGRAELVALTKDGRNMGKTVRQLFEAKNPLAEYRIGQVKLGKIIKNNVEYNTRMVLPSNFNPAQRYPVLLYVYGGPHLQMVRNTFRGGADLWMHVLAEKGYVVFTMDNRGTPARGFDWESKIHRNLGKTEVADQMTGVEYRKGPPAPDSLRSLLYLRRSCEKAPSGVEMTPEGALHTPTAPNGCATLRYSWMMTTSPTSHSE